MERKSYPTDLTNEQWKLIAEFLPPPLPGGRPRKTDLREVVNAILYLNRSGCQWRMIPHEFPPWKTAYNYFRAWISDGVWDVILACLRTDGRGLRLHNPANQITSLLLDIAAMPAVITIGHENTRGC